jgi:galactokinase
MSEKVSAAYAAEQFAKTYGHEPVGVWSAPGRANLIGEHTDYNAGLVLPFAIDRRTYAAIGLRNDGIVRVSSEGFPNLVEVNFSAESSFSGWSAYPLGVVKVLHEKTGHTVEGFDIHLVSDVPTGAGLSSSAAIECAVAVALNDIWGTQISKAEIALIGQRAENTVVGAPTGFMDQFASMFGEQDSAIYLDCRTQEVKSVPLGLGSLKVLVMDTQEKHSHATGGYAARRQACDSAVEIMGVQTLRDIDASMLEHAQQLLPEETYRRVRHVVTENDRVSEAVKAFEIGDFTRVGELFAQSHMSMRDDFEISTLALDLAVESSLMGGAVASRMTGGGFGGAAIALVEADKVSSVMKVVEEAFVAQGLTTPHQFTVVPSQGAR